MDDARCLRFFLEPTDTLHRRYAALRAFFVERRPLKVIAQRSGYSYNTRPDVIAAFRAQCRDHRVPPFSPSPDQGDRDVNARPRQSPRRARPWRIAGGWT